MIALIIGFLMSLGIISTEVEYNNLSSAQQEELIAHWIGEDDDGL